MTPKAPAPQLHATVAEVVHTCTFLKSKYFLISCLGLKKGDVVMVHTSLKSMGYICGGAQTVIEALLEVVGNEGTIMMPTQSWKNLDPEDGVHWLCDEVDWQIIRDNWPAYEKNITPTNTAHTF